MPKRPLPNPEDDISDILDEAPDDLEDEDELLEWFADRLDIDDDTLNEMAAEAAKDAGIVAALALLDLFATAWDALDDAMNDATDAYTKFKGTDLTDKLKDIAEDLNDNLGDQIDEEWGDEDGSSIVGIAEINAQSEYSDAKIEADDDAGWEYAQYIAEASACDVCADCHGVILPSDDPWWDEHEPDNHHPNCKCLKVPLSQSEAEKRGGVTKDLPDVEGGDWKTKWPPDVSDRPDVLQGIYQSKLS